MLILSCYQARVLLKAWARGAETAETSLDLGLTRAALPLGPGGVGLPDGSTLPWEEVRAVAECETVCYEVGGGTPERIQAFSEATGRVVSLYPTTGAPTMLIAGFPMHRIKGVDPWEDTRRKIATLAPVRGRVLDTTTGLGYTAIAAARTADRVVTIELDPTVLEVARRNPWSADLFASPRIEQRLGDAFEVVRKLPDASFDRVFHDPPTLRLAGQLYSGELYRHLHRVLARGGRLFHYVGDLESRAGAGVARGVVKRLQEAGFSRITRRPEAFGVTAER